MYEHMTDSAFKFYKDKLKSIENQIEHFCISNGFNIEKERYYDESLAINLNTLTEPNLYGNISLQYIDKKGSVKFTLGLIKTCDIGRYRHWRKKTILKECTLESFEKEAIPLLSRAFDEYNSIKIEDLTSRIQLPERY